MDAAARTSLADRFRWQAGGCEWLGSPLYAELCRRAAEDVETGGPLLDVLAGHEDDPLGSMLQLRLLGAVHRLALRGEAPALAACYPSTGGQATVDETWHALREIVADRRSQLRELIELPVQTNEVGRARALALGFAQASRATGLPLRLLEVGASGGLNLRWDRFRYVSGEFAFGDPDSPVRFRDFHEGEPLPPAPAGLRVAERAGCDERPVDPSTASGRETLCAYVWPDQRERFTALEGALRVARALPVDVQQSRALPWLRERLAEPVPDVCTVVFHSIVMQYLDDEERDAIDVLFAQAGERASAGAPIARLAFESEELHAGLRLTVWPGGREVLLAECRHHGAPVRWLGGEA